jgi:anti-anti-sigma factor
MKTFLFEQDDDTLIVAPLRDLGSFAEEDIQEELAAAVRRLQRPEVRHVVVDFENIVYFGSTMLSAINKLWKSARQEGGRLVLCHLTPRQREVLEVTKLNTVWPMCGDREEALRLVRS